MKRHDRLCERRRFEQVRREGQCWSHRLVVLCTLPNELPRSRFGFSASKRIGGAVVRNKARRRLKEIVRLRLPVIASGWDVVLIARPPIAQASYRQIETAVDRLFQQAGLYGTTMDASASSVKSPPAPDYPAP